MDFVAIFSSYFGPNHIEMWRLVMANTFIASVTTSVHGNRPDIRLHSSSATHRSIQEVKKKEKGKNNSNNQNQI